LMESMARRCHRWPRQTQPLCRGDSVCRWNSMGVIGGFAPAHFLDQAVEPGGRTQGPWAEIALQSGTDGVAD
jgi:hypothetical protein